jgi:hypothetical protein
MQFLYEPQYALSGYFDDSGKTLPAWWDRDITSDNGPDGFPVVIALNLLEPGFVDDPDVIFLLDGGPGTPISQLPPGVPPTSGIWVQLVANFFDDDDLFFHPMSVRALDAPDYFLKNEVRRIR